MKKTLFLMLAGLAALIVTSNAKALGVGDAAPPLKVSKWVKGEAVEKLATNKTYVVEFWATWCGPCRTSIPHLSELAHQFTNVTFIGVDVWEQGPDKEATVTKFIAKMGDKMDYRVAMDTEDGDMANSWMKAAEQNGIPAAFVVQGGKIIWIGHPMSGLEETLKEAASGKFDLEKSRKRAGAMNKVEAFYKRAMLDPEDPELAKEGKELEALDQELGGFLPGGNKFNAQAILAQVKFQKAMRAYQKAVASSTNEAEIAQLEAAARSAAPKDINFDDYKKQMAKNAAEMKESQAVAQIFTEYATAVGENGDKEKAAELGKQLGELKLKNPELLNALAWAILTEESFKVRDLALATKLAKSAVDNSEAKSPAILDTYSRALFDSGKVTEAIENQKKAVAISNNADEKAELEATLKKYQAVADRAK